MFTSSSLEVKTCFGTNSANKYHDANYVSYHMHHMIFLQYRPYLVNSNDKTKKWKSKRLRARSEREEMRKRKRKRRGRGELRNVRELCKYEGSAPYCRCSAISLRPDISHINHFSQIDTEKDEALLPLPHPTASQHWE